MLAFRALGLDCGPTATRAGLHPRLPLLDFDEACKLL
jgi:hypothetical protein